MRERKIALYIDVDNLKLNFDHFESAVKQLDVAGDILFGRVYGVSERRHKAIVETINNKGFNMIPVMRKKRKNAFDYRILVDCMEDVLQNNNIDTVAIIACPTDLIWLYSRLNSYDIKIIALENNDEENNKLVDDFIDIGLTIEQPAPKPVVKRNPPVKTPAPAAAPEATTPPVAPKFVAEATPQVVPMAPISASSTDFQTIKEIEDMPKTERSVDQENEALLLEIRRLLEDYTDKD